MQRIPIDIAIVIRAGRLLICQRKPGVPFAGYWEFPGGKREPGESSEQCLARELAEEVGIIAKPLETLPIIEHDYPHASVRIHPYLCEHVEGEARPIDCAQVMWIEPAALPRYVFPPANESLISHLIQRFARRE